MALAPRRVKTLNTCMADMSVAGAGWILAASPVLGKICVLHEGQPTTPKLMNQWFTMFHRWFVLWVSTRLDAFSLKTGKHNWLSELVGEEHMFCNTVQHVFCRLSRGKPILYTINQPRFLQGSGPSGSCLYRKWELQNTHFLQLKKLQVFVNHRGAQ